MSDFTPSRIYGVIGHPLGHSLSPLLHTTAFQTLGLPAVLVPWPLEPGKLPAFIEAFRLLDIQGACVTIPHKQAILPLLDEVSERAGSVGAVNLIYRREGRILGDNTDIPGFMAPLTKNAPPAGTEVLLLGAGGAARAAAAGLKALGLTNITVTDLAPEPAAELARAFNLKLCPWEGRGLVEAGLVVNATPLGMRGRFEAETAYRAEWFAGRRGLAYDIVYTPLETRFLREAEAAGWARVGGLEMFIGQAEAQFKTWTGLDLPEAARQAVAKALA